QVLLRFSSIFHLIASTASRLGGPDITAIIALFVVSRFALSTSTPSTHITASLFFPNLILVLQSHLTRLSVDCSDDDDECVVYHGKSSVILSRAELAPDSMESRNCSMSNVVVGVQVESRRLM